MARLPQPGNDSGQWGDILNDFLLQSLKADGTLKPININAVTGLESASANLIRDPLSEVREALSDTILADVIESVALVNDHLIFTTHNGDQIDLGNVRGVKGDTGLKGDSGDAGPIGQQGVQGATGPQGNPGSDGATGAQGPIGNTGAVGATGAKGDPGDLLPSSSGPHSGTIALGVSGPETRRFAPVGPISFTLPSPSASVSFTITLIFQMGTTPYAIAWPAAIKWPDGVIPVVPQVSNSRHVYNLFWDGNGWEGVVVGLSFA